MLLARGKVEGCSLESFKDVTRLKLVDDSRKPVSLETRAGNDTQNRVADQAGRQRTKS